MAFYIVTATKATLPPRPIMQHSWLLAAEEYIMAVTSVVQMEREPSVDNFEELGRRKPGARRA